MLFRSINLGLEQVDLAKQLSLSNRTISKYELGQAKPSYEILSKLADIFNCSTDYLIGRTNDRNNLVFSGVVDGDTVEIEIDKSEKDLPTTDDKFYRLVRKLREIGFNPDVLMEEIEIDLDND